MGCSAASEARNLVAGERRARKHAPPPPGG